MAMRSPTLIFLGGKLSLPSSMDPGPWDLVHDVDVDV